MARIETDPNYSSPTFSRATAATDLFKKEDVQLLAAAMSTHVHDGVHGLPLTAASIPSGLITSAMIADGTIATADIAGGAVTAAYLVLGTTVNPTTTSTSYVDMPDMTADITVAAGSALLVWGACTMNSANVSGAMSMTIAMDGNPVGAAALVNAGDAGYAEQIATFTMIPAVSGGSHQIRLKWGTGASNTITAVGTQRTIVILEVRR
jgi:hypothetical protein